MDFKLIFADIGEGLHEAEILQWFINVGDHVEIDQPIVEVQTDKAAVEITSPKKGLITKRNGEEGDTIYVGDTLVEIELDKEVTTVNKNNVKEDLSEPQKNNSEESRFPFLKSSSQEKKIIAAPSVRKFARESGINLKDIQGSEKNGRITKQDVLNYLEQMKSAATLETIDKNSKDLVNEPMNLPNKTPENEILPIRGLRKQIYKNMTKSAFTIPHVTGMEEINAERLVHLKSELNKTSTIKITYLPIIVKFVVDVLKRNPIFNATIDEENENIILKKEYNIGIAMATPQGLIVPVIHHADKKSVEEVAIEIAELNDKALKGKLSLSELQGGTFTISSTGANGGFFATPIINYPQVAILGIHSIKEKPVILPNREVGIGYVMGISLSFDHRIIDGEPAGKFMNDLKKYMETPELWFLKAR
ncbi:MULTISPECIES: dihydrolipoamide acetyltransferase family protein [Bacillaceae]|jgi:pyruvate dehydrogenase E2 component (dihydrolipoamide acetyltransferase)|uniref:dihydrolipoamide acetyltransferase family protein n=1 Tax=Bacillaceae TaxID=186817 RepID=UPI000D54F3F2|nr:MULTISPECIES: dihydrolipoamide acetyltransferase family protein [Bacillaceae]AWI11233.1 dienelactone hydrolase [Caldibacillus thermoamylovorans]MBU5343226.1 2-oxo acid dehydrogenase subunit E2 [Caldifermentibacillus hisashii]